MATPGTGEPPVMNPPSYQQYTSYPQNAHAPLTNYNNAYYLPPPQQLADDQQDVASDDGYNAPGIPKEYLNTDFEKCFQEHKSTETFKPIKKAIGFIFKYTKLIVYNILVIVFGFLFAAIWAIIYGIHLFILIWIWSPLQRLTLITIHFLLPLTTETLRAVLYPPADAIGRIFRQIRIKASFSGGLNLQGIAGRTQNV